LRYVLWYDLPITQLIERVDEMDDFTHAEKVITYTALIEANLGYQMDGNVKLERSTRYMISLVAANIAGEGSEV